MTRVSLDNELQGLQAEMIQLGSLVVAALTQALEALATGNQDSAGTVVMSDKQIDDLHLALEAHTFRVLLLQQPLAGRDLRYLTALVPMAIDLERIGDEAESIAQHVLRMMPLHAVGVSQVEALAETGVQQGEDEGSLTDAGGERLSEDSIMQSIFDLGREVRSLLEWTMKAFADRDAEAARGLWEQDEVVDRHCYAIRRDVMTMLEAAQAISALQHDSHVVQRATHLLRIAYELERVADHCTNVCERIVFIVEGETDILTSLHD